MDERHPAPRPRAVDAALAVAGPSALAPLFVFLLHLVCSRVLEIYREFPALAVPMHVLGGVAIALWIHASLGNLAGAGVLSPIGDPLASVLTLSLTATATVFWEFAEFTTDAMGITRAQAGLADTMLDMAMGVVGGVLFVVVRATIGSASES